MRVRPVVRLAAAALAVAGRTTSARAVSPTAVRFDPSDVGRPPAGFTQALTGGGGPVSWVVRHDTSTPDGSGTAVVQESADDTSYRFPLCVYDGLTATDVSATVRFKTVAGSTDQAAGLVLRYAPENYYVARANALEDNVNLFKTVDGQRLKLAEIDVNVAPRAWHTLTFAARGPHLTVSFDGKDVIRADDATFAGPGNVGLWTKADSVTEFAGLQISTADLGTPATTTGPAPARPAAVQSGDPVDAAVARAHPAGRVVAVLIVDPARGDADRSSTAAFRATAAECVTLDLGTSANRAAAARLHPPADRPALVCLSPAGLVVSHDDGPVTTDLVRQRVAAAAARAPALDRQLAKLRDDVTDHPADMAPAMALADFLIAHQTDREAIPIFKRVSDDSAAPVDVRVRAWVALGRAHLWVGEPEKARHAAQALMAALPQVPDAVAGGNLVRGLQDTKAKRFDRARDELTAAVAAAPRSTYGEEAAGLLAKLPGGTY